ncbi:amino acid transporter [Cyanobacteria bacterium FACHB-DQ100]|nr:amino acid transporter [Cyanobacteria bacterium FACHB-DQ100]
MVRAINSSQYYRKVMRWLLEEDKQTQEGPYSKQHAHRTHAWWKVMCLTGVDYFSTLGYQPGIAALAAGNLSPVATLILVLLTLFGALPIYQRVAAKSPHGEGSIAMLEHLLPWWQGKFFVLCLLGFVATDFIITITLSAADATAHVIENPLAPHFLHDQAVAITLVLITLLGAVFLKGFQEAIGLAVFLVSVYLLLNLITIGVGISQIVHQPTVIVDWQRALFASHNNPVAMLGMAALLFPKLALGLSGFETGVVVMPLVKGSDSDTEEHPTGRIRNTRKLLTAAALIMSLYLLSSSLVTTLLIPPAEFKAGGEASGRALAYLAHRYLGGGFGTVYDLSTIAILWFAGASAMAGLLNIVPRYLPRYGMAPNWARVTRPLVLVYTAIAFTVTILFRANVEAQGGAYATGVLVLMTSAAVAVTLSMRRHGSKHARFAFGAITLVFLYTTLVNIIERPEGIRIAGFFIAAIILTSLVSRVWRSTELRVEKVEMDETAHRFITEASQDTVRVIANRLNTGDVEEYYWKEKEVREDHHIPESDAVLFLEVQIADASEFANSVRVKGITVGDYRILRVESAAVPNAIAAILLYTRDQTGKLPHAYFGWVEGNPIQYLLRFILFGEGDIAVVTREVLRKAEKNPQLRPAIHVGG